ncbi:MAG: MATE family efflux transporter [Lachnospiraceae bacterium]|nr:MATE family efflux transporter [Lachnospiraceae bacterium]
MSEVKNTGGNPLGIAPVKSLMLKFAIPSIIAMLVGALYNIVDQLFIGNYVGSNGNAATNIAFPLTTACLSISLLFGIGGASCFNLNMGKGEKEKAPYFIGNSAFMLFFSGVVLSIIAELFLDDFLIFFGSPAEVLPYATEYVRVTAIGFPFLMLTTGGGHLIRADGSPKMTMVTSMTGAIINTALDAVFVIGFKWGMFGAALATIIGQIISAIIVIVYLANFKTVPLIFKHFKVRFSCIAQTAAIGMGSFINQIAMMFVQIILNNSLKYYGARSVYGEAIPIAVAGIVIKVAMLFFAVVIGIAQGSQPIESFNYGAKNYKRVREAYKDALIASGVISVIGFALFQFFPRNIIALFGDGSEEYFEFGVSYFKIYLFFICLNFLQPVTATFFTSIGKAFKGAFLSLTRQVLFLIPLILILPRFMGIDGILYSGPISDAMAIIATVIMAYFEFRGMKKLEKG